MNLLFEGDNLPVLRLIEEESVDLVYLDPPFRSERSYITAGRNGSKGGIIAFDDRWSSGKHVSSDLKHGTSKNLDLFLNGIQLIGRNDSEVSYLHFMGLRLIELRRALKPTGSIYLHCDQSASSLLKLLMDSIFGCENYLNSIVWCYGLGGSSNRRYPRKHDDIFWYSKLKKRHYFEPPLEPAKSQRMKGKMKKVPDYWHIPSINNMADERTGYPTQKPVTLLKRIIQSSCPPGGVVLDPFCGSGTTLTVASKLRRNWVGIDMGEEAIATARRRLEAEGYDKTYAFKN